MSSESGSPNQRNKVREVLDDVHAFRGKSLTSVAVAAGLAVLAIFAWLGLNYLEEWWVAPQIHEVLNEAAGDSGVISSKKFTEVEEKVSNRASYNFLGVATCALILGVIGGFLLHHQAFKSMARECKDELQEIHSSAKTEITTTYNSGKEDVKRVFALAKDEAEAIRRLLKETREGHTYLLRDTSEDLIEAHYTWIFGKLTYFCSSEAESVLIDAIQRKRWKEGEQGIIFYVPESRAGAVMTLCRRIRALSTPYGISLEELARAMTQAIVAFVPDVSDTFPVQIVMYSKLPCEISWNADTARRFLAGKPVSRLGDAVRSVLLQDEETETKLVAFLDDLVSMHSSNGQSDRPTTTSTPENRRDGSLGDLVGLQVQELNKSSLLTGFRGISDQSISVTSLGKLIEKCAMCTFRETKCLDDRQWLVSCANNEMLVSSVSGHHPGTKMRDTFS